MPSTAPEPECLYPAGDAALPHSALPVLVYRQLSLSGPLDEAFPALFAANLWPPRWRDQVYDFAHYHADAHEALGVLRGRARLWLGGEGGCELQVQAGDALVLPAGTAHREVEASEDFLLVGAYPPEQSPDLQRADPEACAANQSRIAQVAAPLTDPVGGSQGALVRLWRQSRKAT